MDVFEAMAKRRTIRDFSDQPVETELIQKIIAAGFHAPSNNHMREWHFVVLQDREQRMSLVDRIIHPISREESVQILDQWGMTDADQRGMYLDAIPKQYNMILKSTCLIVPCFRQTYPLLQPKTLSSLNGFASIWACIENILVAAAAEGILGVTRIPGEQERQAMKEALCIPTDYEIPCWMALGYPAQGAFFATQKEIDIEERIHWDVWEHARAAATE